MAFVQVEGNVFVHTSLEESSNIVGMLSSITIIYDDKYHQQSDGILKVQQRLQPCVSHCALRLTISHMGHADT